MPCDDLEGWGGRGREAQEGRNIYICESVKVKVAQSCLILQPHGAVEEEVDGELLQPLPSAPVLLLRGQAPRRSVMIGKRSDCT